MPPAPSDDDVDEESSVVAVAVVAAVASVPVPIPEVVAAAVAVPAVVDPCCLPFAFNDLANVNGYCDAFNSVADDSMFCMRSK